MQRREGPVVLVIMDGCGYGLSKEADAFAAAVKPNLDWLHANCLNVPLNAHGTYVGLPSDADIGNSEVGHNAMGCGRVFAQGAKLVSESIATGEMWQGEAWKNAISHCQKNNSKLHFLGLFSDGNVHSHIDHLKAMVETASPQVKEIRLHCLFDGRDVGETSAMNYIVPFEKFIKELNEKNKSNIQVASGGGRMYITMDRYNADWKMVERGWNVHVHAKGRQFASMEEAYTTLRTETGKIDQNIPEFVIAKDGKPVGKIEENDAVIFYNFRGDRAVEITQAFESKDKDFHHFDRKLPANIFYAGMMQYDGDLKIPKNYLVNPPKLSRVSSEFLAKAGITTLAISETQKFGHVTYFYNGNRSGYINEKLEKFIEIPSDNISFDLKPWMKCGEITDVVEEAILNKSYDHIRLNFPNGDMVGHTGVFNAVKISCEAMDIQIGRIMEAVKKVNGVLLITADHGNADQMYELTKKKEIVMEGDVKKVCTAHSLNKVPFIVYDPSFQKYNDYDTKLTEGLGISSIAATIMNFLHVEVPADYDKTIVVPK
ncbi:2 [Hexamita inflata]|uniref:phosphoglycerate mutase (2,3-diphosphoglycerate-independent) n=1 Tax=Hexamita inflata TaxID=28002 RepID=A0AA86TCK7_9EUKA|nr:2 [Hexamita inflata] [Hexamita inflata]